MRGQRVQSGNRSGLADQSKQLGQIRAVVQALMLWKALFSGRFRFGVTPTARVDFDTSAADEPAPLYTVKL